jgi:TetR/AcrR family transcriptional regulator, mexJK operon transcriptional repressor
VAKKRGRQPAVSGRRSDQKKLLILRAAREIFLKAGFAEASMDAISALSGVSKMTIYRHFENKEELFAGVITELCDQIVGLEPTLATGEPLKQALAKYADRFIDTLFAAETLQLHRVVVAECGRFPDLGKLFFARGPKRAIDALTRYLKEHHRDPQLRSGLDAEVAAIAFLDLLRGYAHMKALLGIEAAPSGSERRKRIAMALAQVLR